MVLVRRCHLRKEMHLGKSNQSRGTTSAKALRQVMWSRHMLVTPNSNVCLIICKELPKSWLNGCRCLENFSDPQCLHSQGNLGNLEETFTSNPMLMSQISSWHLNREEACLRSHRTIAAQIRPESCVQFCVHAS